MKLLHTSDWHVGKTIRGNSRAEEHRAVLAEIVAIAAAEQVDVVLVAGDLFETATPTPEAEQIVYRALLDLANTGATVAVIAGNHDNARRLRAVTPLLELGSVRVITEAAAPGDGGVQMIETGTGERLRLAMLPFVSTRNIVKAADIMANADHELGQAYADRMRVLTQALTADFADDAVNVVMAHAFVSGADRGGGERQAHMIEQYWVPTNLFPATAAYVALGHIHRPQKMPGATQIHYCGSPLQMDFGEERQVKQVNVVTAGSGIRAKVRAVTLHAGRELRTVTGRVAELAALAADTDDAWLRVRVTEKARSGLAEEVRAVLGERAVDITVQREEDTAASKPSRAGKSPTELFAEYLRERDEVDPAVEGLFADLLESAAGGGS